MKHPLGTFFHAAALILFLAGGGVLIYYEIYTLYLAWQHWSIWGILAAIILPGIFNIALFFYVCFSAGTLFTYYTFLSIIWLAPVIPAIILAAFAEGFKKKEG
ncbi:MAG TPA: hypothetical protein PLQ42_09215 [Candidatus Hydrogenedentes bacterium]|jgi:hypothetical protein|nr:MAG: hypothetical protein BWY07_00552 [Candidatus Hydrogenedentes bacterium ADurb.Bin170]HNZ49210.1 hypothetical protein [Candidatus Hydrogenedentota bacterium]HOD96615.1 hypothetical protein [Candidatus Hydrogenedentota bacterium]HOR51247.1 hypothetical protein [Candidatus Hydrogenedentota bacterium]HPK25719.1 hypothetical protein [Candidatus Hydrogenedentota bacterium]